MIKRKKNYELSVYSAMIIKLCLENTFMNVKINKTVYFVIFI